MSANEKTLLSMFEAFTASAQGNNPLAGLNFPNTDLLPSQGLNKVMQIYTATVNAHLENNLDLWKNSFGVNVFENSSKMSDWYQKRMDINKKFAQELFQATLELHSESLDIFGKINPVKLGQQQMQQMSSVMTNMTNPNNDQK